MLPGWQKLAINSVRYYKKPVTYQILIIALLSAVITGSLLTGWSVRASLKKMASEHLGNTGVVISSGTRFFSASLADRLRDSASADCTGLLALNGFCQNIRNQKEVTRVHIYAVRNGFFSFHGNDTLKIKPGEVLVNGKIAAELNLRTGEDLIIRFSDLSDIPADAPFAPSHEEGSSVVLRTGAILDATALGNFSLAISQEVPYNVFINLSDIIDSTISRMKINRILVSRKALTAPGTGSVLAEFLRPSDIGISLVPLVRTGGYELRSDRIFLDRQLIDEIEKNIPSASPVITYLGNSISSKAGSAPYSFVAALPANLYPGIVSGNDIIINQWLAQDLSVKGGDKIGITWYAPDSLNKLVEKSGRFTVRRIVKIEGIWADSLLMPAFPGISGRESCSDWDAGVPVKLSEIRKRDEDYWNRYRGTPKAFIGYEKGADMWGNNFGPATAMRFPVSETAASISARLSGHLDPGRNGFRTEDLYNESVRAANESVDFSSLFLSLGFFLILASVVLLSFAVTSYLESKQKQIRTFFALGFRARRIGRLFISESVLISFAGCFAGSFGGILVSMIIIKLLNTVWQGAVQTTTLSSFFSLSSILTGFLATFAISVIFFIIKVKLHLRNLTRQRRIIRSAPSRAINLIFLLITLAAASLLFIFSLINTDQESSLSFGSGALLLAAMLFAWRHFLILPSERDPGRSILRRSLSRLYYSYYPSHAVAPVLFIAAGLFAVFITGANRMSFEGSHLRRSGGTGGFLLWCDNSIPIRADLTTLKGRTSAGLDEEDLSDLQFVQMKRFAGNDASCLNLNHVTMPPLLGVDPEAFISQGSFSFAKAIDKPVTGNYWQLLELHPNGNTIYGIADQTVIEWGLKIRTGDTLSMRAENGQQLNVIIAGGLKSSVFQGYVLIGMDSFRKYFPSVAGSSVMLVGGNSSRTDLYAGKLNDRLASYGIKIEKTDDRLASFYQVTNTYLSVFGIFGVLGMITGIAGLGFVLLRNYNYRRREFALMLASGFRMGSIRKTIFSEQLAILIAGIVSGVLPAAIATLPSLKSNAGVPWLYLGTMIAVIFLTGLAALIISLRAVTGSSLTASLKKE